MRLALNSGIQTYQILTNDDEVCIPSLSSILLAVKIASLSKYYLLIEEKQDNYMAQFQTNYPNDLTPKSEKVNL